MAAVRAAAAHFLFQVKICFYLDEWEQGITTKNSLLPWAVFFMFPKIRDDVKIRF